MDLPRPRPRWIHAPADPVAVDALQRALDVSAPLARILVVRGLTDPDRAARFLEAGPADLAKKRSLKGLYEGAALVRAMIAEGAPVTVYGDYDVDGLTGSTILYWALRKVKAMVSIHVPDRNRDGYGLSLPAVEKLAAAGTKLLITVDNGTTALTEIARARELGMKVIILDHHQPGERLPDADCLINPLQEGCEYPFKGSASVSLAFKLGEAILEVCERPADELERFRDTFIDLVAIGTIADMVPLVDENRHLVRHGLERLSTTAHPGLRCLMETDEPGPRPRVDTTFVAMRIAPKINAAGRIAQPIQALDLLLARDEREARTLARNLDALNRKRRRLVETLVKEVMREPDQWRHQVAPILILRTPYIGLMGLIAQRVKDLLYRPAFALALHEGVATGSGRSVDGFDLIEALRHVETHVIRAGGHAQAVGVSVKEDKLEDFVQAFHERVETTLDAGLREPRLVVDDVLRIEDLTEALAADLDRVAPFGKGNETPCFHLKEVRVDTISRGGPGGQFAFFSVRGLDGRVQVVAPYLAREALELFERVTLFDLAGHLIAGPTGLQFSVKAMRASRDS